MSHKNINVDPNIIVTQGHIDKLFDGIGPMLEKYKQDNPLICDSECQNNKQKTAYYEIYLSAKNNLQNAPQQYEEAEKNYFVLAEGGQSYADFKLKQANDEVEIISNIITDNFNTKVSDVQSIIDQYNSQIIYSQHIGDLKDSYGNDVNRMSTGIKNLQNKAGVNDRLAYYYNNQINYIEKFVFYFRIFYWIAVIGFIGYIIIYKKQYNQKKQLIKMLVFIIVPFIINPIIHWIFPTYIHLPPPEPVCPTKPFEPTIGPDTPSPPSPPVPPTPPVAKKTVEPSVCPPPTLWGAIKNLF